MQRIVPAILASTALIPTASWSQEVGTNQSVAVSSDEIVVTARRREEILSKVPIAVTALSADTLTAKSIHNENDLQSAVPGLIIKQSGSQNAFNYVIRGQTIDTYTNSPPGVLPYINEAQVVSWSASSFYDMAGIQVLKGPQGTLFGRNTTGGAVLFETAKPSADFEGYLKGRYGRFGAYQIDGALNLPLGDLAAFRVAASKTGGNDYIKRLDTGSRYGNLEQESIRGTLQLDPAPGVRNTLVIQHTSDGGTNAPSVIWGNSAYACGNGSYTDSADCAYAFSPPNSAPYFSNVPDAAALEYLKLGVVGLSQAQRELGPFTVIGQNTSLKHRAKGTFAINTTEIEISDDLLIKNIMLYNRSWSDEKNDYDGSPFPLIGVQGNLTPDLTTQTDEGRFYNRTEQYSEELQLQGNSFAGRLDYTAGLYYIHQKNLFDSQVAFFDFYPIPVYGATTYLPVHYVQEGVNDSFALFAQGSFALTDRLNLTAGFRYTWDETTARQRSGSDWYGCDPAVCGAVGTSPAYEEAAKVSKPSWNLSVDFQATPQLLVYVTTRGSWRAGGFNYSLAPNPAPADEGGNRFLPETVRDVEIGLKYNGYALGFPAQLNVAVYNQWVKNIQRGANLTSPVTGTSILTTVSVPKAEITGVEADMNLRPVDWLELGGSLAYTDARFTDNMVYVPGNPPLVYGPYADVPDWSGTFFAQLSHDMGERSGEVSLRGDLYFQSSSTFANLGSLIPGAIIPSYELVGARLSWSRIAGSGVTASLYGRNLFNEKYITGGNPTGFSAGFNTAFPGFPRTYGFEVIVDF